MEAAAIESDGHLLVPYTFEDVERVPFSPIAFDAYGI